jgi:hypothetical protein
MYRDNAERKKRCRMSIYDIYKATYTTKDGKTFSRVFFAPSEELALKIANRAKRGSNISAFEKVYDGDQKQDAEKVRG